MALSIVVSAITQILFCCRSGGSFRKLCPSVTDSPAMWPLGAAPTLPKGHVQCHSAIKHGGKALLPDENPLRATSSAPFRPVAHSSRTVRRAGGPVPEWGRIFASSTTERASRSSPPDGHSRGRDERLRTMRRVLRTCYRRRFQLRRPTGLGPHSRMQCGFCTLRGIRPAQHLRPARRSSTRLHRAKASCSSWRTLVPPRPIRVE